MQGFAYFPAIVYRDERPDLADGAAFACAKHLASVRSPEYPMCQTPNVFGDSAFNGVVDYVLSASVGILQEQGYSTDKYEFYLSGLWAQEVGRGGGTAPHVHKNSQISGWLFVKASAGGAYPIYYDTRMNKAISELDFEQGADISNATNMIHFNSVVPGTVLFANSWMQHQLVGGYSEEPTQCLHFVVSHRDRLCSTC